MSDNSSVVHQSQMGPHIIFFSITYISYQINLEIDLDIFEEEEEERSDGDY